MVTANSIKKIKKDKSLLGCLQYRVKLLGTGCTLSWIWRQPENQDASLHPPVTSTQLKSSSSALKEKQPRQKQAEWQLRNDSDNDCFPGYWIKTTVGLRCLLWLRCGKYKRTMTHKVKGDVYWDPVQEYTEKIPNLVTIKAGYLWNGESILWHWRSIFVNTGNKNMNVQRLIQNNSESYISAEQKVSF